MSTDRPANPPRSTSLPVVTPPADEAGTLPLSRARAGMVGRVASVNLMPREAEALRAMGLRPGVRVRVFRRGSPCIVEVLRCEAECEAPASCGGSGAGGPDAAGSAARACACRIGLSGALTAQIEVTPALPAGGASGS